MEELIEAQQQRALKNFIYRQNYYTKYQKENRDKCVMSSKKYFDSLMKDEEEKAEYKKKKKQEYYQRVGKERYIKRMKEKKKLKEQQ
jgi:poly-beta-hydroxyalkanoate depolymerase